jgi:hypothetical protein
MRTEYELIKDTLAWLRLQPRTLKRELQIRAEAAKELYCRKQCYPKKCYSCGYSVAKPVTGKGAEC